MVGRAMVAVTVLGATLTLTSCSSSPSTAPRNVSASDYLLPASAAPTGFVLDDTINVTSDDAASTTADNACVGEKLFDEPQARSKMFTNRETGTFFASETSVVPAAEVNQALRAFADPAVAHRVPGCIQRSLNSELARSSGGTLAYSVTKIIIPGVPYAVRAKISTGASYFDIGFFAHGNVKCTLTIGQSFRPPDAAVEAQLATKISHLLAHQ